MRNGAPKTVSTGRKFVLIFSVILLGILAISMHPKFDNKVVDFLFNKKEWPSHFEVELGGQLYRIHADYLYPGHPRDFSDRIILMSVRYPEMLPGFGKHWTKKWFLRTGGGLTRMLFLVNANATLETARKTMADHIDRSAHAKPTGNYAFGLHQYLPDKEDETLGGAREVLVDEAADGPSYIMCTLGPPRPRKGGCNHRFWHNGFMVNISYMKNQLPEWRERQGAIIRFMEERQIDSPSEENDSKAIED